LCINECRTAAQKVGYTGRERHSRADVCYDGRSSRAHGPHCWNERPLEHATRGEPLSQFWKLVAQQSICSQGHARLHCVDRVPHVLGNDDDIAGMGINHQRAMADACQQ
jgi:hypothetical protein